MAEDFPWYKSYPSNVPKTVDVHKYKNLVDVFDSAVARFGDKIAYQNMGATLTFNQLDEQVNAFAYYLQKELGLGRGDKIAIQMPNLLQFPVAFFGALKAGLTAVNTNPMYSASEMEHQFKDADIKALVILENFATTTSRSLTSFRFRT